MVEELVKNPLSVLLGGMESGGGGESGGTDVSATTATEADVLNGKKFYKADGTFVSGTIAESQITETTEKVTVGVGYVAEQKEFDIQSGGGGSGAFDIVKVTEYSPYVPAYPDIYGVDVYFTKKNCWMDYGVLVEGTDPEEYIDQQYQGVYTPTEETLNYTGFGRVFRNANGMEIRGYDNDTYSQGTEGTVNGTWIIVDGRYYQSWMGPMDAELYSHSAAKNPWDVTSWGSQVSGEAGTVNITRTAEPVREATDEIPMVLKGVGPATYDTETKIFTDGANQRVFTVAETTPIKHWYYVAQENTLIGQAVKHPNIVDDLVFHHTLAEPTEYDDLGVSRMTYNKVSFAECAGRMAMNGTKENGAVGECLADIFPRGNSPFTLMGRIYMANALNYAGGFGYGTDYHNSVMYHINGTFEYDAGSSGRAHWSTYADYNNRWLHIALSYNGSGLFTFYIDGESKQTTQGVANISDSRKFLIHTTYETPNVNNPNVYYSDIRLYRRCLTEDDISQIMSK